MLQSYAICNACHVEVKVADDASFEGCTEVLLQVMRKGQDRANKLSARDYATWMNTKAENAQSAWCIYSWRTR